MDRKTGQGNASTPIGNGWTIICVYEPDARDGGRRWLVGYRSPSGGRDLVAYYNEREARQAYARLLATR